MSGSVRFAWLTPGGTGAIAVARVWGPGAIALVTRLLEAAPPEPPRIARRWLAWEGERIDEVVVRPMRGVDADDEWCEISAHGGVGVAMAVRRALARVGAVESAFVPSLPRACAEAELAMARAPTELALDCALHQRRGALDEALARVAGACELAGDAEAVALGDAADLGDALFAPRRVVIAGPSGVGKSRLFNALLGEDRALTGAGGPVTRDWLAEPLEIRGIPFVLVDTPADPLVARGGVRGADILVRLHWADTPPWPPATWAPRARLVDRIAGVDTAEVAHELVAPLARELARGVERAIPVHPAQVALARALMRAASTVERGKLVRDYQSSSPVAWPVEEER